MTMRVQGWYPMDTLMRDAFIENPFARLRGIPFLHFGGLNVSIFFRISAG